jgi:hypothetical protein
LKLISEATPWYSPQPYQQLAAGYRAAGDDANARKVLIAQHKDQIDRGLTDRRVERTWARLTGITLGYGYQPWRALVLLLLVVMASLSLAVGVGGGRGGLARVDARPPASPSSCSLVQQIGVGIDVGLPLVTTGAREECRPTETRAGDVLRLGGWGLQALAWAFATLFIAGFTNAVRKA